MTCRQLGGACDLVFEAETFDEMAALSKKHGSEMYQQKDEAHLKAMNEMMTMMKEPKAMEEWMNARRQEFDRLPEY